MHWFTRERLDPNLRLPREALMAVVKRGAPTLFEERPQRGGAATRECASSLQRTPARDHGAPRDSPPTFGPAHQILVNDGSA